MILFCSTLVSATTVEKRNSSIVSMGETHETFLIRPWDQCDDYNEGSGDIETDSNSCLVSGSCSGSCDLWGNGGGEGSGYIVHWFNFDCPVSGVTGNIDINYKYTAFSELDCSWAGTTSCKLMLTFFINDDEHDVIPVSYTHLRAHET